MLSERDRQLCSLQRANFLLLQVAYLIVLVGSDSGELGARENERLSSVPIEAVDVLRLHNV